MQTLTDLQAALSSVAPRGRGRRFPPELKSAVVAYVGEARARGVTTARLESDLGVSWTTLARWRNPAKLRKSERPKAIRIRVAAPEPAEPTLVSPSGWRVEGLTFEQLRVLVGAR